MKLTEEQKQIQENCMFLKETNILNETEVQKDDELNMTIQFNVIPSYNYGKNAYFKVYTNKSVKASKSCSRINFYEPIYIVHGKDSKEENRTLTGTEKYKMIKILKSPCTDPMYHGMTVWKAMIKMWNEEVKRKGMKDFNLIPESLHMPDYTQL